jgi:dTDP-4-dehydrorhamnose reductase
MGSMRTIVLFGGGGFVGGNIASLARRMGWRVVIADSAFRPGLGDMEWRSVDIADPGQVRALLTEVAAEVAVNVAAIADVDRAEREPDLARRVNVEGAKNVAEACASLGARYVFFSSDAVFDGARAPYAEEDPVAPVNHYGRTKAEAERAVLAACPSAVVIRISLVLGFPVTGGNSFYAALESKLAAGASVSCPVDELRTPIDVLTLAECVMELAGNGASGLLHLGATASISRYELTRRTALLLGYDAALAVAGAAQGAAAQGAAAGRAPRHTNGIIKVDKARRLLRTPMLGIDETIARALTTRVRKGGAT